MLDRRRKRGRVSFQADGEIAVAGERYCPADNSFTARQASSIADSVIALDAESVAAMLMLPNRRLPRSQWRLSAGH